MAGDDLNRHLAGHLSGMLPSHPVGHDKESDLRLNREAILVEHARLADICERPNVETEL